MNLFFDYFKNARNGKFFYSAILGIFILAIFGGTISCDKNSESPSNPDLEQYIEDSFTIEYPQKLPKKELEKVISAAKRGIGLAKKELDVEITRQIKIKVYASTSEYCQATGLEWWKAGASIGQTIHLQPPKILLQKGILYSTFAHEFAYFAIKEICSSPRPLWFIEGIASFVAREGNLYADGVIRKNIEQGNFFSIGELDNFLRSEERAESRLAYWQSNSIVSYIAKEKGKGSLRKILSEMEQGKSFEDSLKVTLNLSLKELESSWKRSLRAEI